MGSLALLRDYFLCLTLIIKAIESSGSTKHSWHCVKSFLNFTFLRERSHKMKHMNSVNYE